MPWRLKGPKHRLDNLDSIVNRRLHVSGINATIRVFHLVLEEIQRNHREYLKRKHNS